MTNTGLAVASTGSKARRRKGSNVQASSADLPPIGEDVESPQEGSGCGCGGGVGCSGAGSSAGAAASANTSGGAGGGEGWVGPCRRCAGAPLFWWRRVARRGGPRNCADCREIIAEARDYAALLWRWVAITLFAGCVYFAMFFPGLEAVMNHGLGAHSLWGGRGTAFNHTAVAAHGVKLFVYPGPEPGADTTLVALSAAFRRSPYATSNPANASLFLSTVDLLYPEDRAMVDMIKYNRHLWEQPFFSSLGPPGTNHIVTQFSDAPSVLGHTGNSMLLKTSLTQHTFRRGFDVMVFLPQKRAVADNLALPYQPAHDLPLDRPRSLLLSFRGKRYLDNTGTLRNNLRPLTKLSADADGVVVDFFCHRCKTFSKCALHTRRVRDECAEDLAQYRRRNVSWPYHHMMAKSWFTLCPAGRQQSTYRLREALAVGSIPVIYDDQVVLPFDDVIPWHDVALFFPEAADPLELPVLLRAVPMDRRLAMITQGRRVFARYLADADSLVQGVMESLERRERGLVPLSNHPT